RGLAEERAEHQRHPAPPGMARLPPGPAIDFELFGEAIDALPEEVGQYIRPGLPGLAEGVRIAGGGDPTGKLGLDRARPGRDLDVALGAAERSALSAPEGANGLDAVAEDLVPLLVRIGREREVARLPARCERDAHPSV